MDNSFSYVGLYVPWYSPQFCKGVWYHPFYPVPMLLPSESPSSKDIARAQTPLQALDVRNIPPITPAEIANLNSDTVLPAKNQGKFFVVLSQCEDDIHKSLKYGIWTTTHEGNYILNNTFVACKGQDAIYLFFSVMGSGMFVGVAEMISHVNFSASFNGWYPDFSNLGYFSVRWIFVKDISFCKIKFIKLHQGLSIITAADCQEIPRFAASKLLKVFAESKHFKSLLEDFDYYNRKEEVVLSSLV